MADFFEVFVQAENMLFSVSLLVFIALAAVVIWEVVIYFLVLRIFGRKRLLGIRYIQKRQAFGPSVVVLLSFFGFFGLLGLVSSWLLGSILNVMVLFNIIISTLLSGVISYRLTSRIARLIASIWPSSTVESYGFSHADVAGCLAEVLGEKMDSSNIVRISVTDTLNNMHTLRGQLVAGYDDVEHGGIVRIIKHDEKSDICFCEPASASVSQASPSDSVSST